MKKKGEREKQSWCNVNPLVVPREEICENETHELMGSEKARKKVFNSMQSEERKSAWVLKC